jgi:hypothetical protein
VAQLYNGKLYSLFFLNVYFCDFVSFAFNSTIHCTIIFCPSSNVHVSLSNPIDPLHPSLLPNLTYCSSQLNADYNSDDPPRRQAIIILKGLSRPGWNSILISFTRLVTTPSTGGARFTGRARLVIVRLVTRLLFYIIHTIAGLDQIQF